MDFMFIKCGPYLNDIFFSGKFLSSSSSGLIASKGIKDIYMVTNQAKFGKC